MLLVGMAVLPTPKKPHSASTLSWAGSSPGFLITCALLLPWIYLGIVPLSSRGVEQG